MNFPFFIANRYFTTKKKRNFVHVVSWVSFFGVAIGTCALILVLSVFNGFEDLILKMYNSFHPHLKITSADGKDFNPSNVVISHYEISDQALVLEEDVLLKYQEKEFIARVKGVSSSYKSLTNFDSLLVKGHFFDVYENKNVAVVGRGISYYLSMGLGNIFEPLKIYAPNRNSNLILNPRTAFKEGFVLPIGIFGIQSEIDEKYIITPLLFIQNLLERTDKISSIEIKLNNFNKIVEVQEELKHQLGGKYIVKNRLEQQDFLYKILNTEKLAVFLILVFIMIIAMFNIIGSLSMLILDKADDIKILKSFGVTENQIRIIFFNKSMLTIFFGIIIGVITGLIFAFIQQSYGIISLGSDNFVVASYPILIKLTDVFLVSITVLLIGLIASWYPAKLLSNKLFNA